MRIMLRDCDTVSGSVSGNDKFQPYLDTFLLDESRNPLGGVLVLPGGGYSHRALHEGDPVAKKFNALGYHAFVLQYRIWPDTFPAPQQDLIRAVKIIRSHAQEWYLDKLAVLGFSAGGHLAASGTMLSDEIDASEGDEADKFSGKADAMVLCYPVISLTDDFGHGGSGDFLFGKDYPVEKRSFADMNKRIDQNTPPAFLWHAADDSCVPVKNSTEFAEKMWEQDLPCELHVFPAGGHGGGLGDSQKDLKIWPELAANFLEVTAGFKRA